MLLSWMGPVAPRAQAQDVTLTSRDGGLEISGTLLTFDGEFYRLRTEYGDLTLDGSGVNCDGPGCPDLSAYVARATLAGPSLMTRDLLPALLRAFARQEGYAYAESALDDGTTRLSLVDGADGHEVAILTAQVMPDDAAFAGLLAGQVDLVLASRSVRPDELALAVEAGLGNLASVGQERVVALDAIVAAVAPSNPVRRIALNQLARVLTGEITNWADLGGIDAPIELHLPDASLASYAVLQERLLLPEGLSMLAQSTRHADLDDLTTAVAGNPFALGLGRLSRLSGARALALNGACGFAASATPDALKAEDYPLPAPLLIYQGNGRLPKVLREFLRFTATPAAQIAVLRAGFVDQGFARIPVSRQGLRLANAVRNAGGDVTLADLQELVRVMQDRSRLTITFRFLEGTTTLDAQSRSNIRLLGRALESGTLGARRLTFVGFSDGQGDPVTNRRLSLRRAEEVRDAVLTAAPTLDRRQMRLRTIGLGEVLPLACDDTAWGRHLNRRVELWVE